MTNAAIPETVDLRKYIKTRLMGDRLHYREHEAEIAAQDAEDQRLWDEMPGQGHDAG